MSMLYSEFKKQELYDKCKNKLKKHFNTDELNEIINHIEKFNVKDIHNILFINNPDDLVKYLKDDSIRVPCDACSLFKKEYTDNYKDTRVIIGDNFTIEKIREAKHIDFDVHTKYCLFNFTHIKCSKCSENCYWRDLDIIVYNPNKRKSMFNSLFR